MPTVQSAECLVSAECRAFNLSREAEVFVVKVDEVAPFLGNVVLGEDGDHWAHRLAGGTVDALVRMNEILVVFIFSVDAVHGADIHAGAVLQVYARLGYDIGHLYEFLLLSRCGKPAGSPTAAIIPEL